MLLYYITDRTQFPGTEAERRHALLQTIAAASRYGVDFIQLREKDLGVRDLENLARAAVVAVRENSPKTRLLINSRSDVALACGADGVHLRSDDVDPHDIRCAWTGETAAFSKSSRQLFARGRTGSLPVIGVSCHSADDVARAAWQGADFAVFAPVFEKKGSPPVHPAGIEALRQACRTNIPVLALGGVTLKNADACREAGAAGVAGIRLFQENDIAEVVQALRG